MINRVRIICCSTFIRSIKNVILEGYFERFYNYLHYLISPMFKYLVSLKQQMDMLK